MFNYNCSLFLQPPYKNIHDISDFNTMSSQNTEQFIFDTDKRVSECHKMYQVICFKNTVQ